MITGVSFSITWYLVPLFVFQHRDTGIPPIQSPGLLDARRRPSALTCLTKVRFRGTSGAIAEISGREISLSVELCLIADQGEPSSVRAAANSKNGQQWNVCTWFQLEKRWRFTIWWSPVRTSFLQQGKLGRGTVSFTPSPEHIYVTNASHTAEVPPRRTQHHIDSGEGDCSTLVTVKSFMTWTWSHMV